MSENPAAEEEAFFDFKCPYCEEQNSFPTTSAQSLQDCASCGEMIIVPEAGAATAGKLPLPITTPRLVIRRLNPEDTIKLLKLADNLADPDQFAALPVNEMNVDEFIEGQRTGSFTRSASGFYLVIELVENQELVGYVWPYFLEEFRGNAGFNLSITPARRRQGLGLEAARATLDFAFDGLCAHRVAVSCRSQNAAAVGMLEKMKMRREGEFLKSQFDGRQWVDVRWYALLKEERPAS